MVRITKDNPLLPNSKSCQAKDEAATKLSIEATKDKNMLLLCPLCWELSKRANL